jgi:hypothetical protein
VKDVPELPACETNNTVLSTFDPLPPERGRDPYLSAGCHPDVVERVWDGLGRPLSRSCAFITGAHPVLAHPATFVIFAFPWGTAYALWLPPPIRLTAEDLKTVHRWGGGNTTNLAELLGDGWVWGQWRDREHAWCQAAIDWWDEHPPVTPPVRK